MQDVHNALTVTAQQPGPKQTFATLKPFVSHLNGVRLSRQWARVNKQWLWFFDWRNKWFFYRQLVVRPILAEAQIVLFHGNITTNVFFHVTYKFSFALVPPFFFLVHIIGCVVWVQCVVSIMYRLRFSRVYISSAEDVLLDIHVGQEGNVLVKLAKVVE